MMKRLKAHFGENQRNETALERFRSSLAINILGNRTA